MNLDGRRRNFDRPVLIGWRVGLSSSNVVAARRWLLVEADIVECLTGIECGLLIALTLQQILILRVTDFAQGVTGILLPLAQVLGLTRLEG